ncbi:hypothetical protein AVEN_58411-1 [Araneus ventricosus]|uniref:Uncharacterized protein n=1 Tax=Araneus ventricosus TaxID=182803 RepID=A0A4Y2F3P9_ARAVE|nr:hypothetical protein AVEN_58411-1 [Araneus ventricosus]
MRRTTPEVHPLSKIPHHSNGERLRDMNKENPTLPKHPGEKTDCPAAKGIKTSTVTELITSTSCDCPPPLQGYGPSSETGPTIHKIARYLFL